MTSMLAVLLIVFLLSLHPLLAYISGLISFPLILERFLTLVLRLPLVMLTLLRAPNGAVLTVIPASMFVSRLLLLAFLATCGCTSRRLVYRTPPKQPAYMSYPLTRPHHVIRKVL